MMGVKRYGQFCQSGRHGGTLVLCLVLSLLLHGGAAFLLDLLPRSHPRATKQARPPRHVQVLRATPRERQEQAMPKQEPPQASLPSVKTPADAPNKRPEQADFTSNHDSVASGEADAPQRRTDVPLPTMTGRDNEEELVTFDQERQDGDIGHEGKQANEPVPSTPESPADAWLNQPAQPQPQGHPDGSTQAPHPQGEGNEPPQPMSTGTASVNPTQPAPEGQLRLQDLHTDDALTLTPQQPPPAPLGQPDGVEIERRPLRQAEQRPRQSVYDPSLTAEAQLPGLRTYERRTRSTGRFVFGRRPALNVTATPRGRYEAEIYRRIARTWYAACDEHRGDIIPGSITISLRLTRSGGIDSMDLIRRRGASVIQQSFSFGAIRRAALPPMPPEVQQSIIGELYEMILTFNFD